MLLLITKGKTAVQIKPDFTRNCTWIETANALPGKELTRPIKGEAKFDWKNKIVCRLNAEESALLASIARAVMDGKAPAKVEIFRDPTRSMNAKDKTKKVIRIQTDKGWIITVAELIEGGRTVSTPLAYSDLYKMEAVLKEVWVSYIRTAEGSGATNNTNNTTKEDEEEEKDETWE